MQKLNTTDIQDALAQGGELIAKVHKSQGRKGWNIQYWVRMPHGGLRGPCNPYCAAPLLPIGKAEVIAVWSEAVKARANGRNPSSIATSAYHALIGVDEAGKQIA